MTPGASRADEGALGSRPPTPLTASPRTTPTPAAIDAGLPLRLSTPGSMLALSSLPAAIAALHGRPDGDVTVRLPTAIARVARTRPIPDEPAYHLAAEVFARRFGELLAGLQAGTVPPERLVRALTGAMPWQISAIGRDVLHGLLTYPDPVLSEAAAAALVSR